MEIKRNLKFDKMQYLRTAVNQFIHKETVEYVDKVYSQLIEHLSIGIEPDATKRKILKICRDLFTNPSFRETISNQKKQGRRPDQLVNIVVNHLSPKVLGRHYDMSNLRSEGMISSVFIPNKTPQTVSEDKQSPVPSKPLKIKDLQGNTISIEYLETIHYKTGIIDEYIKKYKITRYIGERQLPHVEVYTELDFCRLSPDDENSEYYRAVANHLLSIENIKYSNANGYIGGLTGTSTSTTGLRVGEERFDTESNNGFSSYTYQISPNQALYFDRIQKEAVKVYLERTKKREENDGR